MSYEKFPDFKPLRELDLPQIRATVKEFEHLPTGLRLLHLSADDPENCFALTFATPPSESTGVPHILEHAVLAGSERFPVKEPFFELIKSSPAGFINAMTSDVFTIYPICTTLEGDFFNLADVYADAVFHPLLTQDTFEREGHHLELAEAGNPDSDLVRSGIVYNEMKGAYSNTEMVLGWRLKSRLFPGGSLGVDAGGDPQAIPDLTWQKLREFYAQFYAPGNCTLLVYGDIPTEKHLEYWGEKLVGFERKPSLAARPKYDAFDAPRVEEATFAVEPNAEMENQTFLSLRIRCGDGLNRFEEIAWSVLSRLLSGHDSAPLKKALVDSQIGADVMACGVEDVESELTFHVALKGSEPDRAERFQTLVLQTLENVANEGFSQEDIDTAIRQVSYSTLEVPRLFPLHLAFDLARYSACGADPLEATKSREKLDELREIAASNPAFFGDLIRRNLLENPHRLLIVYRPDKEHAAREEALEKDRLATIKASLSREDLEKIDARAQELLAAQNEPNSPEALATLPRLAKSDLPLVPREIPTKVNLIAGFDVLRNDVFSNGVVYLHAAVDLKGLPPHLWKFLPRYCDAFSKVGVDGSNWQDVSRRRAAFTGGLHAAPTAILAADGVTPVVDLRFQLKTLDGDFDAALELWRDLIFALDPNDAARVLDIQKQALAGLRGELVNEAMGATNNSAAREQSPIGWLNHLWDSSLTFAWNRELNANFDEKFHELAAGIVQLRDYLLNSARWTWSFTGSDESFSKFENHLLDWQHSMALESYKFGISRGTTRFDGDFELPKNLGLAAPLDVQFCAKAFPSPTKAEAPQVDLGLDLMKFDYFLPEIRLKGNAYGGGSSLSPASGTTTFYSYRDPRLKETLDVFDGALGWAKAQSWSEDDLERALLGNVSDAVPAIRPADATTRALTRYRRGETESMRAESYKQKLSATPSQVQQSLVAYLERSVDKGTIVVAASRANLENANRELEKAGKAPLTIEEMLPEN